MGVKLIVLCLFSFSAISSLDGKSVRLTNYYPEEEDMYRVRTLIVDDGNGKYYKEDLTVPPDSSFRVSSDDVNFYLYTKSSSLPNLIPSSDIEALQNSRFKPARKNVFIAHGWRSNSKSSVNTQIKRALLKVEDVNIFVVDWSGPASGSYVKAKSAVPQVGKIVGTFINNMLSTYGISTSQFYLIGHSLGAHVVGCAGAAVDGLVHSIVGLDPAGPLYTLTNIDHRIDPTDGAFVHIIHTNSKVLGFRSSIGHVDYYPDGGAVQDDCGKDRFGTCSHSKSYEYYALSITGTTYNATKCGSYRKYLKGKCDGNPTSLMGNFNVDRSASGDYYFTVNSRS